FFRVAFCPERSSGAARPLAAWRSPGVFFIFLSHTGRQIVAFLFRLYMIIRHLSDCKVVFEKQKIFPFILLFLGIEWGKTRNIA
ncbi:MAG: hypothetical protein IK120_09280, partial [Muribaculaceae bacterium]|nr:hypothetical protein [Muribaculaceae bacterium]